MLCTDARLMPLSLLLVLKPQHRDANAELSLEYSILFVYSLPSKLWIAILGRENHRKPSCASKCFHRFCFRLCPNCCSDGHEEAKHRSQTKSLHGQDETHPNVAAEPSIYCPSVLPMPLGPAPNLAMFVAPETVSIDVRYCS